jgi:TonB family C-terminal domain
MQHLDINSKEFVAKAFAIILSFAINLSISWGFVRLLNVSSKNRQNQVVVYLANITQNSNLDFQGNYKNNKYQKNLKKIILRHKAIVIPKIPLFQKTATQNGKLADSHIENNFFNFINSTNKTNPILKDTQNDKVGYLQTKPKKEDSLQNSIDSSINIENFPKIKSWIDRHKFYPQEAIFKQEEGIVKITFLIDRNRNITHIKIAKKSPSKSLNKAALKILKLSSPIPMSLLLNINLPIYAHINIIFRLV